MHVKQNYSTLAYSNPPIRIRTYVLKGLQYVNVQNFLFLSVPLEIFLRVKTFLLIIIARFKCIARRNKVKKLKKATKKKEKEKKENRNKKEKKKESKSIQADLDSTLNHEINMLEQRTFFRSF